MLSPIEMGDKNRYYLIRRNGKAVFIILPGDGYNIVERFTHESKALPGYWSVGSRNANANWEKKHYSPEFLENYLLECDFITTERELREVETQFPDILLHHISYYVRLDDQDTEDVERIFKNGSPHGFSSPEVERRFLHDA